MPRGDKSKFINPNAAGYVPHDLEKLRKMFWREVDEHAPHVLQSLFESVYKSGKWVPIGYPTWSEEFMREAVSAASEEGSFDEVLYGRIKDYLACLETWATCYSINTLWVRSDAHSFVTSWSVEMAEKSYLPERNAIVSVTERVDNALEQAEFTYPAWNPSIAPESYYKLVDAAIEEQKRALLKRLEGKVLSERKTMLAMQSSYNADDVTAFVLKHLCEWDYGKIVELLDEAQYNSDASDDDKFPDTNTVEKRIQRIRKPLGL